MVHPKPSHLEFENEITPKPKPNPALSPSSNLGSPCSPTGDHTMSLPTAPRPDGKEIPETNRTVSAGGGRMCVCTVSKRSRTSCGCLESRAPLTNGLRALGNWIRVIQTAELSSRSDV